MDKTYNIYHLVFIIILSIHYSLSLILFDGIIFGQETDVFEAELLFNKILGDIYKQDYYILNSLLGGVYEWYYFTRALFAINYIYSFFSTENAFLIVDILCKIFAYISFFKLSKLLNNNNFYSFLISGIYSYISTTTFTDYHSSVFGFGSVVLPYLTYLTLKNKNLKIKNYLFIIFAASNSHFYFGLFYILVPFILHFYDNNLSKIRSFKIFIIFLFFCFLANSNLFYLGLFSEITFNRDNWDTKLFSINLYENIIKFFDNLFNSPFHFVEIELPNGELGKILYFETFFIEVGLFLIHILTLYLLLTNKIKNSKLFLSVILGILIISFISKTQTFSIIIDYFDIGIIKTIKLTRIKVILTFIFLFAVANIQIKKIRKYIYFALICTFSILQVNYMIVPGIKKYINFNNYNEEEKKVFKYNLINFNISELHLLIKKNFNVNTNDNYYTIDNWYDPKNFSYIKKIVKDEYVLPIDINPAKLTYNYIKTPGGYFQFYPQSYKKKFRKIIANELEKNISQKKIFDDQGHRLYAFVFNNKNIELNFQQIKKMNISYVLSEKKLYDKNLKIVCENCNSKSGLNLYLIL
tara:strand:+ start:1495 stop:3240 length:1746 start_codon:yes stop_codon:yes gene_type:complete